MGQGILGACSALEAGKSRCGIALTRKGSQFTKPGKFNTAPNRKDKIVHLLGAFSCVCTQLWTLPLRKMGWRVKKEEEATQPLFSDGSLITLSDNGARTPVIQKVELKLALVVGRTGFSTQEKEHCMRTEQAYTRSRTFATQ